MPTAKRLREKLCLRGEQRYRLVRHWVSISYFTKNEQGFSLVTMEYTMEINENRHSKPQNREGIDWMVLNQVKKELDIITFCLRTI
jgi:hypothetical protein